MAPTRLSYSSLSLFRRCPQSWKARYIDEQKTAPGTSARFGNDFDTLVALELGCKVVDRSGNVVAAPEITPQLKAALDAYRDYEFSWLKTKPEQNPQAQVKVEVTPEQWAELAEKYGSHSTLAYPLIGYIDLGRTMSDGVRYETLDLKTKAKLEFDPDWNLQSVLYAVLTGASKCSMHVIAVGSKKPRVAKHELLLATNTPLVRNVMDWYGYYSREVKRVQEDHAYEDLPRSPGYHCSWCSLASECPIALAVK